MGQWYNGLPATPIIAEDRPVPPAESVDYPCLIYFLHLTTVPLLVKGKKMLHESVFSSTGLLWTAFHVSLPWYRLQYQLSDDEAGSAQQEQSVRGWDRISCLVEGLFERYNRYQCFLLTALKIAWSLLQIRAPNTALAQLWVSTAVPGTSRSPSPGNEPCLNP